MDNQSIYAAPKVALDIDTKSVLLFRPKQLKIAVAVLWLSLVVGISSIFLSITRDLGIIRDPVGMTLSILLGLGYALQMALNFLIYQGKNWARIVMLCWTIISLFFSEFPIDELSEARMIENVLYMLSYPLDVFALILLFTKPCSHWFKRISQTE